jgi:hypothetical protein
MPNSTETQTVLEPVIHYCRTCGHAKEAHNLDFRGSPEEAHQLFDRGEYVCHHMTGNTQPDTASAWRGAVGSEGSPTFITSTAPPTTTMRPGSTGSSPASGGSVCSRRITFDRALCKGLIEAGCRRWPTGCEDVVCMQRHW